MHRPHIMIVDDDPMLCDLVSRNLRNDHFEVSTASDGASGLAAAERQDPDLFLVDVSMPDCDTVDFIRQVREAYGRRVPIICMTGFNSGGGSDALEAGADDYVAKPFSPDLLLHRIRNVLDRCA